MFHLAGFYGSLAAGPVAIPTLTDPALVPAPGGVGYQFQRPYGLMAAAVLGNLLNSVSIVSPTLRIVNPPFIRPVNRAALFATTQLIMDMRKSPFTLPALESVYPQATNSGAGPTATFAFMWLNVDGQNIPVPNGQRFKIHLTSTGTAVANAWTQVTPVFDQQLPSGNFAICGSEHISATAIAHRIVFPNSQWRPGSLSMQALTTIMDNRLLECPFGVYNTFLNTAPPNVEVLCTGADASHDFYWDLIPIQIGGLTGMSPNYAA